MDDHGLGDWLALREATDAASRSAALTTRLADALGTHEPLRIVDLATGTGSNLRYLIEHLPARQQEWLAVDRSSTLLSLLPKRLTAWGSARGHDVTSNGGACAVRSARVDARIDTRQMDLGTLAGLDAVGPRHLVTASALLDLVSERWLETLAAWCRRTHAAALFTITYNGRSTCDPAEPEDELVLRLFNAHQHTDKGLGGPAAGPDAPDAARRAFVQAGFEVQTVPSDWRIAPEHVAFQRELIEGWASASSEMAPADAALIDDWRKRRLAHVDAGRSRVTVGHDDLAAWLPHPLRP